MWAWCHLRTCCRELHRADRAHASAFGERSTSAQGRADREEDGQIDRWREYREGGWRHSAKGINLAEGIEKQGPGQAKRYHEEA
jgi:hypothetical protein